jgi:hypothetical protein
LVVLLEHYSRMLVMFERWMVNVCEFLVHYSNELFYEKSKRKRMIFF